MDPGKRLGPYEIIEQLGAGGMGEVWLATDTRLERNVAVKVLPEEFAGDPERLARFEQEARAAAALNHPHIAAVHDVGESDGTHYMVQEYLDGESLDRVLARESLPLDRIVSLGVEIAEGLIAAHAAEIVHRDLKPANIFVTAQGHAKILDFGLAKLVAPDADAEAATVVGSVKSPTALGTTAGQIMGTAGYMAPEQVAGDTNIDRRADLFSFGCVLYEAVTGSRPFRGENLIEILHAISNRSPRRLAEVVPDTPVELDRILSKCLAKRREDRYQHADDVAVDLRAVARALESGGMRTHRDDAAGSSHEETTRRWPWLAAIVVVVAGIVGVASTNIWVAESPGPQPTQRFVIEVSATANPFAASSGRGVALSTDGTLLAIQDRSQDSMIRYWLRELDSLELQRMPTANAVDLQFSPDNRFFAWMIASDGDHGLIVTSLQGDQGAVLSQAGQGFSWLQDGSILFAAEDALWTAAAGEDWQPTKLVDLDGSGAAEGAEWWDLVPLPGNNAALMVRTGRGGFGTEIVAVSLETGTVVAEVVSNAFAPIYAGTGHLLFARTLRAADEEGATLMAVAFDPVALEVKSEPVVLQTGVGMGNTFPVAQAALSPSGTLAYLPHQPVSLTPHTIVRVRPGGGVEELLADAALGMYRPRLDPAERRVALEVLGADSERDIWVYDLDRAGARLKLTGDGLDYDPVWSNDGRSIAFSSNRTGREQMYTKRSDGGGTETPLLAGDLNFNAHTWHPDGQALAYYSRQGGRHRDIGILHTSEDPPVAEPFIATEFNERGPAFSPNGRWITYASDRSGRDEVYVTDYPEQSLVEAVSLGGGREPVWSGDGRAIYYRRDNDFYRVEVTAEPTLALSEPTLVASGNYVAEVVPRSGSLSYDVMADGSIVAVRRDAGEATPLRVVVVTNFLTELAQQLSLR